MVKPVLIKFLLPNWMKEMQNWKIRNLRFIQLQLFRVIELVEDHLKEKLHIQHRQRLKLILRVNSHQLEEHKL